MVEEFSESYNIYLEKIMCDNLSRHPSNMNVLQSHCLEKRYAISKAL
jgi:hypothetical protein